MISRANWANISSVDGDNAIDAANRILPPLVSLILVVLIAWQAAKLVWTFFPGPEPVAIPAPAFSPSSPSGSSISADVSSIAGAHIFGVADAEPDTATAIASEDDNLEDTNRVLTLNGTVASEIPRYSIAIISDGGNDQ